jgi:hypothetical protein
VCHELTTVFAFILLIKNTERIVLNGFIFSDNYLATIEALPPLKVQEMIKKRLEHHEPITFFAFHSTISFFNGWS